MINLIEKFLLFRFIIWHLLKILSIAHSFWFASLKINLKIKFDMKSSCSIQCAILISHPMMAWNVKWLIWERWFVLHLFWKYVLPSCTWITKYLCTILLVKIDKRVVDGMVYSISCLTYHFRFQQFNRIHYFILWTFFSIGEYFKLKNKWFFKEFIKVKVSMFRNQGNFVPLSVCLSH